MIETIKNSTGFIIAFIIWYRVNDKGGNETDGKYCYVSDVWIHENFRRDGLLGKLINMMDNNPIGIGCDWVYWTRDKYSERLSKTFNRYKIAKKGVINGR